MPRQSSKESKHFNDDRSLKEYSKAWYEKMVQIWLDRYSDFEIGIHPPAAKQFGRFEEKHHARRLQGRRVGN